MQICNVADINLKLVNGLSVPRVTSSNVAPTDFTFVPSLAALGLTIPNQEHAYGKSKRNKY